MIDEAPLKGMIYTMLEPYATTSVSKKISSIMDLLRITAYTTVFPPQTDRIHLANGTLLLNGIFIPTKEVIVRSRFPVCYKRECWRSNVMA